MDLIYIPKISNLILKGRYVLVIDNKNNRRLCHVNSGKVRIGKKEIDMKFFENKLINSFWQIDMQPYEQISNREFFEEDVSDLSKEKIIKFNNLINKIIFF